MAKLSHNDSRRMYSWWWDSHMSPKNSKWLQENLTDMDAKVKSMIKLIEEDADSFARRAEMYYKKRPELMKMVEEFYRAYRALAERYDHATGVIRQAHRTMSEACPDHFSMMFGEDSLGSTMSGTDLKTPDLSLMDFTDESESVAKRKAFGLVQRVRRGLNFNEVEQNEPNVHMNEKNGHVKDHTLSEYDKESESDEIVKLKKAIAKLEAEKEAGLVQYQQSLNKLSQLEDEISKSREDLIVFNDRAKKAEEEVIVLKESLSNAEAEKESNLHEYQQCLDTISKCNERAHAAESEVECLKAELDKLSVEKEDALSQYMQSLETVSNLENKLRISEEDAQRLKERADSEIETLKQTISKLIEEKEASALLYQQYLEKISSLELKLACAEEEAKRLNVEIDNGLSKLKGTEEKCLILERSNQSLHTELETLMLKMGTQNEELSEKQKELGRLWASIQEERLRFVEAETAFQTLQHLHAQTQEELRAMAFELQNRAELLKTVETQNQILQDEVLKVKEENKNLDELNASSALSIKDMQNEISSLTESKGKLEQEVEMRVDQRNALQQEIYCLKEEVNDLNKKHIMILDQVHYLGLDPESFGSSVKELREENLNLKETCQRESTEKADLLKKLVIMDQLLEKNSLLETSLSDLNAEFEAIRSKIEALERSCESLLEEKSNLLDEKATLMTQLEETNKNLEKVSENNTVLVNFLSDANDQLEALKAKSKILEDSCQLLVSEKAGLVSENDGLKTQLKMTQTSLEGLEKSYKELESRCSVLENEKESNLRKVEELEMNLDMEMRDHVSYVEMSKTHLSGVEAEMHHLREESLCKSTKLDQMLANVFDNEVELFIFSLTCREMKENNYSLLRKNQKLLEETDLSEKTISKVEKNNLVQKADIESLSVQLNRLRTGNVKLLEVLDIGKKKDQLCKDSDEQDQVCNNLLVSKLQEMKEALVKAEEENLLKTVDFSVIVAWIKELKLDLHNIVMEKYIVELEVKELKSKLKDGDRHNGELMRQIDDLNMKLLNMQETCDLLRKDNLDASEEKRSLIEDILSLQEKNDVLLNENDSLSGEVLGLENFSLIFRSCADEKFKLLKELEDDVKKLHNTSAALLDKLSFTEEKLEESKIENCYLKEILHKTETEFNAVSTLKDQMELELKDDILKLQEKNDGLSNENDSLSGKVLDIENFSFIFRSCADEKFKLLKELGIEVEKLRDMNAALSDKLSFTEQKFEESKIENCHLKDILQNTENDLNAISTMKDQMELQIKDAEKKISVEENEKLQLNKNLADLTMELSEVKVVRDHQGDQIHKLSADNELLNSELKQKINEINELETEAESIFGQLQYFLVTHLLYEQKFRTLHDQCLGYIDQNEVLETQLAAYGTEIASLRECIMSLENRTEIHIKFQDPQNEKEQDSQASTDPHKRVLMDDKKATIPSSVTDLHDLHVRLEAIVKSVVKIKEQMLLEILSLQSKLDNSTRQLELLQSGNSRSRRHHHHRSTSEITEEGDNTVLLTKDIVLDQVSDGSSYGFSKRDHHLDSDDQNVEMWESRDLDGTVGLKIRNNKDTEFRRIKSLKKLKSGHSNSGSDLAIEKEMDVDKLEISKRSTDPSQETNNKRKVLERLDSDVQKLANLQITVRDLKRILEVTEKGKRGKAVIECEAIKRQLEEADIAVMKLFDLNKRLTKNIEDSNGSLFGLRSSFDLDRDEDSKKRRMLEQARRMSEKIGRLSMEIQKLRFVLLKMDDENKGKNKLSEARRRILLRDYLYGGGRTGERRKKTTRFCACVQPSTVED